MFSFDEVEGPLMQSVSYSSWSCILDQMPGSYFYIVSHLISLLDSFFLSGSFLVKESSGISNSSRSKSSSSCIMVEVEGCSYFFCSVSSFIPPSYLFTTIFCRLPIFLLCSKVSGGLYFLSWSAFFRLF